MGGVRLKYQAGRSDRVEPEPRPVQVEDGGPSGPIATSGASVEGGDGPPERCDGRGARAARRHHPEGLRRAAPRCGQGLPAEDDQQEPGVDHCGEAPPEPIRTSERSSTVAPATRQAASTPNGASTTGRKKALCLVASARPGPPPVQGASREVLLGAPEAGRRPGATSPPPACRSRTGGRERVPWDARRRRARRRGRPAVPTAPSPRGGAGRG